MALQDRKYQRATHEQLTKCIHWAINKLQLRDWLVDVYTKPLADLGSCDFANTYKLKATISIDLIRHKVEDENPYSTALHEALHILTIGVCQVGGEQSEPISYRLEDLLYQLYCQESGIKLAEFKVERNQK